MLHTKFRGNRSTGSGEDDFEGFYHIWAWQPSWSCGHHHVNTFFTSWKLTFVEIRLPVPEKKILKCFYHMGVTAILVM